MFDLLFGLDAKAFEKDSEFLDQSINQFNPSEYDHIWHVVYKLFPFVKYIRPNRYTSEKFTKWFIGVFEHAVQIRHEQNIVRDDYLNFLIELKNRKNLPDHILYSHAYTLFLDGYETTAYILGFALNYLSDHQEYQQKLRAEANEYQNFGYDELQQMLFVDSFLNGINQLNENIR